MAFSHLKINNIPIYFLPLATFFILISSAATNIFIILSVISSLYLCIKNSDYKILIKENGINHIIIIGKSLNGNNLNFQKKEPIIKKINAKKSNINKELINDAIEKLNFLKLKIESRISNDF